MSEPAGDIRAGGRRLVLSMTMRRLAFSLFTLCAIVSAVALVATCGLWIRSYWVGDQYYRSRWTFIRTPDGPGVQPGSGRLNERAVWLISGRGGIAVDLRFQDMTFPWRIDNVPLPADETRRISGEPTYPSFGTMPPTTRLARMGFGHYSAAAGGGGYSGPIAATAHRVWFPIWSAAVVTAVSPALWLSRYGVSGWRRRRRTRAGLCGQCGYDLRASPGRCPECGANSS